LRAKCALNPVKIKKTTKKIKRTRCVESGGSKCKEALAARQPRVRYAYLARDRGSEAMKGKKLFGKKAKKGFTLLETVAAVGIMAVLLGVGIPSVLSLQKSVHFKRLNEYAKDVFLAAQSNLTEMRVDGTLSQLQPDSDGLLPEGATQVPGSRNAQFPAADWSMDYYYTTGGKALDLVLPVGSIDATVRDGQILIEYNPVTGNVYAVFYSDGSDTLTYSTVARDETTRLKKMVGYYASTGV
jgi:prepilin-type N-terminal cleavage/methylation domain-containing protein